MKTIQVNIIVDVKQALGRQAGDDLVNELGCLQGVSRAWVSPRTPRMVPARTFHQTSPEFDGDVHEYRRHERTGRNSICAAGFRGFWRFLRGAFSPSLRANSRGYWLGARYTNPLAHKLAKIPRSGEISGPVDFDAGQTDTQRILRTVAHRGFDARLVGM